MQGQNLQKGSSKDNPKISFLDNVSENELLRIVSKCKIKPSCDVIRLNML